MLRAYLNYGTVQAIRNRLNLASKLAITAEDYDSRNVQFLSIKARPGWKNRDSLPYWFTKSYWSWLGKTKLRVYLKKIEKVAEFC